MNALLIAGRGAADQADAAPVHADADTATVRLSAYRPPDWLIETVDLVVALAPEATRVTATLRATRNPAAGDGPRPDFRLHGRALKLLAAEIDGAALALDALLIDEESLTVPYALLPGDAFTWRAVTEIAPKSNTALEGLYMSRDMYCTQCEAQGFRKITYFLDRPDVLSVYTCRVEAQKDACPVLLSNGEVIETGALPNGRHYATWRDPWPKPCYLFALVAGPLSGTNDVFTTRSGRRVTLTLFTRPGDEHRTHYALDALKRSMKWDEDVYGLEYDLDLFMVVAVDDFNMGAMENKGLNIFNSKYVLASPETATDDDYENIESIIAHEYFHNWTGNRVTCRDWFQLCLKEGLTVFRDQQFSEDMRDRAVERIGGVKDLRAHQFREDAGPLAHPVRPESYKEINNFYTATVYQKGAEVVRMLHTLLGQETYRAALDLYFERHDGRAATIEDFVACFETAADADLSQFALWWSQAGTPRIRVQESFDADKGAYRVTLSQSTPPTPGQPEKQPLVIPLRYGLLHRDGTEILRGDEAEDPERARERRIVVLDAPSKTFEVSGLDAAPVLSLNRGFSAPVIVERALSTEDLALLLAHDPDPFSRWEAGRRMALDLMLGVADDLRAGETPRDAGALSAALKSALENPALDPSFRTLLLATPREDELAGEWARWPGLREDAPKLVDPDQVFAARTQVRAAIARDLEPSFLRAYEEMRVEGPYDPRAEDAARRSLRNISLGYLTALETPEHFERARTQYVDSDNMTEALPAMAHLVYAGAPQAAEVLDAFYKKWRKDPVVLGKWFGVQALSPRADALETVERLTRHPDFEWRNPNKFRALVGAFAMGNPSQFHRKDGAGYRFVTDWLLRLDPVNPQTTARLVSVFETWRRYDEGRQTLIRAELERIAATPKLSRDSSEMVERILKADAPS